LIAAVLQESLACLGQAKSYTYVLPQSGFIACLARLEERLRACLLYILGASVCRTTLDKSPQVKISGFEEGTIARLRRDPLPSMESYGYFEALLHHVATFEWQISERWAGAVTEADLKVLTAHIDALQQLFRQLFDLRQGKLGLVGMSHTSTHGKNFSSSFSPA
jgi:hypothetical protein